MKKITKDVLKDTKNLNRDLYWIHRLVKLWVRHIFAKVNRNPMQCQNPLKQRAKSNQDSFEEQESDGATCSRRKLY